MVVTGDKDTAVQYLMTEYGGCGVETIENAMRLGYVTSFVILYHASFEPHSSLRDSSSL